MRRRELDFLRFIAVLLVLGRHMRPCPGATSETVATVTGLWKTGGWIGVDLFFVLSGFLVSGLLFREYRKHGSIDARRFLFRRAFKIYPAFWVLMMVTVLGLWVTGTAFSAGNLLSELLFIQNYGAPIWNHTWSLAVEEHFYLLLTGLLCLMVARTRDRNDPFRQLPLWFGCVAIGCLLLRMANMAAGEFSFQRHLFATHLRLDSLFFGALLAYRWEFGEYLRSADVQRNRWNLILTGGLLLIPAFAFPVESTWWLPSVGVTLFYLGSGAILIGMLHCDLPQFRLLNPMVALGTYSYSIYLWHMPVHHWITPTVIRVLPEPLNSSWWIYACVYLSASFAGGVILCKGIEIPFLFVRDRFFPSRTAGLKILEASDLQTGLPAGQGSTTISLEPSNSPAGDGVWG